MVTKIFAKAHGEPLDLLDETAKITQDGNAFSGGPANYDKQMVHAWAGLNMQGEEGDSSIAGVNMMRRAMFNDKAAGNDKSKKEKGLSMEQLLMIQQAQAWMNDRLGEIGGQLDALANIEQKIFEGTFDPVNNAEDLKLLQAVDPDITAEKWTAMDDEEKRDWVIETRQALEQERADIEELKAAMQKIDLEKPEFPLHEPFSVTNNVFSNPILEEAAKKVEQKLEREIDRHNIDEETFDAIYNAINNQHRNNIENKDELTKQESITPTTDNEAFVANSISLPFRSS